MRRSVIGRLPSAARSVVVGSSSSSAATSSRAAFWTQFGMGVMYVLIILCIGYLFQLILHFEKHSDDELVEKYLLQQGSLSLLQLGSKPKLWIPFFTDQNRAQSGNYLKSFLDRTPEPGEVQLQILQLTLRTIERHNSEQFQIVLVDDSTFSKVIPSWAKQGIELNSALTSQGVKKHLRELGMLMLLYLHGGLVLPASFICTAPLKDTYDEYTENGQKPFFAESSQGGMSAKLAPGMRVMGSAPGHYLVKEMMEHLVYQRFPTTDKNHLEFPYVSHVRNAADRHFEHAEAFKPIVGPFLSSKGEDGSRECNILRGELIGLCTVATPTNASRVIDVDQWFMRSSDKINDMYSLVEAAKEDRVRGLDFPHEAAMDSKRHSWIARANAHEIMKSRTMLSTHLHFALFDRRTKEEAEILNISTVL